MTIANWIRWNSTELEPAAREALVGGMTPDQRRRHPLLHNDYVWLERTGVLWNAPRAVPASPATDPSPGGAR